MRLALILATTCLIAPAAMAQNYVAAEKYNGRNVAVNLDVLSGGASPAVRSAPLPPPLPVQPIVLRPPAPRAAPPIIPAPHMTLPADSTISPVPAVPPPPAALRTSPREVLARARDDAAAVSEDLPVSAASEMRATVVLDEQDELKPITPPLTSLLDASVAPKQQVKQEKDTFEAYRIFFEDKSSELSDKEKAVLNGIVEKIKKQKELRVQVQAFAPATPETVSDARRLSLTRALAVRGLMIKQGVDSSRINVRAMGADPMMVDTKQPPNRVDIIFVRD